MADRSVDTGHARARLMAESADDLQVISALVQDATIRVGDIAWLPRKRRFALIANRFRWEDAPGDGPRELRGERVRSGLRFENVLKVSYKNVPIRAEGHILSLLAIEIEQPEDGEDSGDGPGQGPGEGPDKGKDGPVVITLDCSGFATIRIEAEVIEGYLDDLSDPWRALEVPSHDIPADDGA